MSKRVVDTFVCVCDAGFDEDELRDLMYDGYELWGDPQPFVNEGGNVRYLQRLVLFGDTTKESPDAA